MQNHNYKFYWNLFFYILGFILITFNESLATVPSDAVTRNLNTKLSGNDNQNFQASNLFESNILHNNNNSTPLGNPLSNVVEVSIANQFVCAINNEGKLFCWGENFYGQLGDGTNKTKITPTLVNTNGTLGGSTVKSVSAGDDHTCAINNDNKLFCWGNNIYGQLGNGTNYDSNTPTLVNTNGTLDGYTVKSVSSGFSHTCAISNDNKLFCWGRNNCGQLGDDSNKNRNTPTLIYNENDELKGTLDSSAVKSVSAGYWHTCAINNDNKLFCWGLNENAQLGDDSIVNKTTPTLVNTNGTLNGYSVQNVSAGYAHTCAINNEGRLYCWGLNENGQLGDDSIVNKTTPTLVNTNGTLNGYSVQNVSAGYAHTCAINNDNKLFCWGLNDFGQLGNGSKTNRYTPTLVNTNGTLGDSTVKSISTNEKHTCAISNDNKLFCWGNDNSMFPTISGGIENPAPIFDTSQNLRLGTMSGVKTKSVSTGLDHTCAINEDNKLFCWGNNESGQLGDGTEIKIYTPNPVNNDGTLGGFTVKNVSAGTDHTCAINEDNKLFCWGNNESGQLGDGTEIKIYTPNPVNNDGTLGGFTVKNVSAGTDHTCAINEDNKLFCWGNNESGQLGDGTNDNSNAPTLVNTDNTLGDSTVKTISAGNGHTCVINNDNKLFCWGYNLDGQLGDGTNDNKSSPILVNTNGMLGGSTVKSVSTGFDHTCAINNDNKLFCWGSNYYGQLGDGSNENKNTPTLVNTNGTLGGSTVKSVSAGYDHTCAINNDDKLFCWGSNYYGQLGDGSNDNENTPILVNTNGMLDGYTVKSISGGGYHTCAINNDNKLFCWGSNGNGQLGDGTTTQKGTPTLVNINGTLSGSIAKSVSAGWLHTCAISNDNKLFCWGDNQKGQCTMNPAFTVFNRTLPNLISDSPCTTNSLNLEIGATCNTGTGVCARTGTWSCVSSELLEVECSGTINYPNPKGEICSNTLDDDCDGENDEVECTIYDCSTDANYELIDTTCNTGIGACLATGKYYCDIADDKVKCDANAGAAGDELCNGIDDDCDGEVDEGFTTISGICYANSDIENIDECNPSDVVINNRCYNPADYNKTDNKIVNKIQPLPAIVSLSNIQGKIEILMEKFTISPQMRKRLQKRALNKLGIKNAKLKVFYNYIITKIADNNTETASINKFAKKNTKEKIIKAVRKNTAFEKNLSSGKYKVEYKILIQAMVNKKPVLVWGNQKSNKLSTPVNFSIPKK